MMSPKTVLFDRMVVHSRRARNRPGNAALRSGGHSAGMDAGKIAKILPVVVGIGLCVVEGLKAILLLDSARSPNPANGHTEPALFAPEVSVSWSYITHTQMLILGVATSAVLLLAALMIALQVRGKWLATENTETPAPPPSRRAANGAGKSFGRARRG
jgi:hypothetical protein